jgi:hypothetical protein
VPAAALILYIHAMPLWFILLVFVNTHTLAISTVDLLGENSAFPAPTHDNAIAEPPAPSTTSINKRNIFANRAVPWFP